MWVCLCVRVNVCVSVSVCVCLCVRLCVRVCEGDQPSYLVTVSRCSCDECRLPREKATGSFFCGVAPRPPTGGGPCVLRRFGNVFCRLGAAFPAVSRVVSDRLGPRGSVLGHQETSGPRGILRPLRDLAGSCGICKNYYE